MSCKYCDCSSLTSVSIDMTSVSNLSNTGLNTSILQKLTFGENVTSIASGAFFVVFFRFINSQGLFFETTY